MYEPNPTRPPLGSPAKILGNSSATSRLREEIARVAPFDSSVLITGPSGSGKELVARTLHEQSSRSAGIFVPVDCASLMGELMASQLFGHVEGAFTGASHGSLGCFRAANGGTIFLDEIGELELSLQARLLRTLQERVVTPVGSHEGVPINVRVVAATNRDLHQEVAAGRFREDLYYRLNVIAIRTLPLRERTADIGELAQRFLDAMGEQGLPRATLSPGAIELLEGYPWPGNVRQLKNLLEQAAITSDSELLTLSFMQKLLWEAEGHFESATCSTAAIPHSIPAIPQSPVPPQPTEVAASPQDEEQWTTLTQLERAHVLLTLEHTYYNKSAAARLLGISRQALIRLMKKLDLQDPRSNSKTKDPI